MEPQDPELPTRSLERLRGALEPAAGRSELLVRRALRGERPARRFRPSRRVAALASAGVLAGVLIFALPQRPPSTFQEGGGVRVAISNQGDIVITRRPDPAGGWVVRSGPPSPPQLPQILIVRHGEQL